MTTIVRVHQVLVHAPVQTVFDYVSDLTRHPEWSGGELKIEAVTPGPIAVGKEYQSRGEVAIQKNRPNTVQVTEYVPPHKFGIVANDPDFGKVLHIFTFAEQDGGVLIKRTMHDDSKFESFCSIRVSFIRLSFDRQPIHGEVNEGTQSKA